MIASAGFYYANTNGITQKLLMFVSEKIPSISQQIQKETTTDNSTVSSKNKPVTINETATSQTNTEKFQTIGDYTEKILSPSDYSIIQQQESTQFWVGSWI